ncbi:bifunctional proline dehydrogenase/L-glutamate gamma-semialdehyde dehydrogenase PutA [Paraglaciecola sp. 2405UD69-4]|uniref:bifunctional proline dehydrogenase/L-glutamate gamma-semialdehyde dehydrogenase PutA n=1 Tax=Paraglaciecola sp. 2405UD69-4 TaxID=3391836 RepID=UPI0039C9712C
MQNATDTTTRLASIRQTVRQNVVTEEEQSVENLLLQNPLDPKSQAQVEATALKFVEECRADPDNQGLFDVFLQEYSLSSQEGVVLMCLAEALLRVPDSYTVDKLIAEKIHMGEWDKHIGNSKELLVNAASTGLALTRKILNKTTEQTSESSSWFRKFIGRVGEPVVRRATLEAMKFMGQQYVLGRDIDEAAKRGRKGNPKGTRFSFDMLGEGARTYQDAEKYYKSYLHAIERIGAKNKEADIYGADGISVKLSALHPRYEFSHQELVLKELLPSVLKLAIRAKELGISFTIDAEEAARLDIELDVFQGLAFAPELQGWDGLGFVLQAYQKRALYVVDWLVELAKLTERKLMVRLVKGAYWDAEIKHAQEMGFDEFPVFTRKVNTDLSYQVCAGKLLANKQYIYPQFATHNAYTMTLIMQLAGTKGLTDFEFQRLHGMGELLYAQVAKSTGIDLPLRVYAPVGVHKDLLPYLVRRLLENGANGSFVNQFLDGKVPAKNLVQGVEALIEKMPGNRNTQIPVSKDLFVDHGEHRDNSTGLDLDDPLVFSDLQEHLRTALQQNWCAGPIVNGVKRTEPSYSIFSPADYNLKVGQCTDASAEDIATALESAAKAQEGWVGLSLEHRASCLDKTADLLEKYTHTLTTLISYEAGRTLGDGISEVREAVDFCRYYALQARLLKSTHGSHIGLGEGKGVFVCISPWNFPLAIFIGQVVAALVTGNSVIAKPAEQTPLVATFAVELLHQAGVPVEVLQLLTGTGADIGPKLLASPLVSGVAFTGSTETAKRIQADLVKRGTSMPPFIAETGGQNVMIVDSTALPEQVVDSVIQSAFLSAGQRCSALRVLYLQEDIADNMLSMLEGAIATLKVGYPWKLSSDLGPVIDTKALQTLQDHNEKMQKEARLITQAALSEDCTNGAFIAPQVFEIQHISQLKREVFGPILHVIRYKAANIKQVIEDVNNTGYGLTLGVHSRIKQFADEVFAQTKVGNTYINRNIVGAVVGVNPFGGHGLSGTGFKAGGPHYLLRFTALWQSIDIGGNQLLTAESSQSLPKQSQSYLSAVTGLQQKWDLMAVAKRCEYLTKIIDIFREKGRVEKANIAICQSRLSQAHTLFGQMTELPGPTGEINELSLHARGVALVIADAESMANGHTVLQLVSSLVAGNAAVVIGRDQASHEQVANLVTLIHSILPFEILHVANSPADLVNWLQHDSIALVACNQAEGLWPVLATRSGAIVPVINHVLSQFALLPYAIEKTKTNNIVATGGNAMLLNLKES